MKANNNIAILLATYNGEKYIREQLDSIIIQTYQDWEIFAHDDGSADGTLSILKEYEANYPDKIHVIDAPAKGGAKENFFFLINEIEADYYMFCDQDDVWFPDKIEETFAKTNESEKPILVFTDLLVVDSELNTISESMNTTQGLDYTRLDDSACVVQNVVTGCTTLINRPLRDMMLKVQNYDGIIMHDWWAALIAAHFGEIRYLNEATIKYRQHESNSLGSKDITDKSYIKKRLGEFDDIRASIEKTRIQAGKFADCFDLDDDSFHFRYSQIGNKNKLQRWSFYKKNNCRKYPFVRNLGFYFLG